MRLLHYLFCGLLTLILHTSAYAQADYSNQTVIDEVFALAKLEKADFSYAKIVNSRFFRANLQKADFSYAHIEDSYFAKADLQSANFNGVIFGEKVWFYHKDESGGTANLDFANITGAVFYRAKIFDWQLKKACWNRTDKDGNGLQPPKLPSNSTITPEDIPPCPAN